MLRKQRFQAWLATSIGASPSVAWAHGFWGEEVFTTFLTVPFWLGVGILCGALLRLNYPFVRNQFGKAFSFAGWAVLFYGAVAYGLVNIYGWHRMSTLAWLDAGVVAIITYFVIEDVRERERRENGPPPPSGDEAA